MKKSEIRKYILNHFKNSLKEHGFKYYSNKYRGQGFEKQTEFGFFEISFSFIDYAPTFYCMPYASIRFNEVQDIYNEINPMADWAKPFSTTLTSNLFRLNFASDLLTEKGYKIESDFDLTKSTDEIENKLIAKIFTWFSSLDELEKLNEKINSNLFEPIDLFISDDERMFKGLIISLLAKDKRYLEIENTFRQKCLTKFGVNASIEYEKLVSILKEK